MRIVKFLLMCSLFPFSMNLADIQWSGQAQFRPRLDIVDYVDSSRTDHSDFYPLYRLNLNMKAELGEGWRVHSRLGHNAVSGWMRYGVSVLPSDTAIASSERAPLSFMELYVEHEGLASGFQTGLIPLNGIRNPILDLHLYPTIVGDIPFHRCSNNAVLGLRAWRQLGPGQVNGVLMVDDNAGRKLNKEKFRRDQVSILLEYRMRLMGLAFIPQMINTVAADSLASPLSYGFQFQGPRFAGLTPSLKMAWTSQTVSDSLLGTESYDGRSLRGELRGRIGPGSLTLWQDWAKVGGQAYRFLWFSYRVRIFTSEAGEVTIAPIYRLYTRQDDYRRAKISVDLGVRFK